MKCIYVIETGGTAWQKSKAQEKMSQRTQNVSPLTVNSRTSVKFVFLENLYLSPLLGSVE